MGLLKFCRQICREILAGIRSQLQREVVRKVENCGPVLSNFIYICQSGTKVSNKLYQFLVSIYADAQTESELRQFVGAQLADLFSVFKNVKTHQIFDFFCAQLPDLILNFQLTGPELFLFQQCQDEIDSRPELLAERY